MSCSGRRHSSKWDLREDISPENLRANEDGSAFIEHESRDNMSGAGDLQRSEGVKEKGITGFEGDGPAKSTGLDGGRQRSRTHSSKNRDRSYRSRSRSRSPAGNPRRQPSLNDQSSRSGHSASMCGDFSSGRCRKGDRCHFAHQSNSGRHLDKRIRRDGDDKALLSHSDTYSTGRISTNICNDFLKGRCRRGASFKFPHHESGSDEHTKGTIDGSYQDRHRYDHNEQAFTEEKKSPDYCQPKTNLNGMHEFPGDAKWSSKTSPRSMPKVHDWVDDIVKADAPGDYSVSSYLDLSVSSDIPPGQGIHQLDERFSALPVTCVSDVQQIQTTFPLNPTEVGIEMPYHHVSEFTKQCDPICDSIQTKMDIMRNELMSSSVIPSSSDIPSSLVTGEISISDFVVGFPGDELGNQNLDPDHQGLVNKLEEINGEAGKGTNEAQEQGVGAEMAVNGDVNDDKKGKDVKEMRTFKFALAELVKELLNPAWKEGKMSKEVYKTIVKKVVDKVTYSIQEAHIPKTKEKIDQYLSFSKPKLTKLVQAYLERYKKN